MESMTFHSIRQFKIHYLPAQYEQELREEINQCPESRVELVVFEMMDRIRRKLTGDPNAEYDERIANLERIVETARRFRCRDYRRIA